MRTAIHRIAAALIAVVALIGITSATSKTAHAQCSPVGFTNTSGCFAEITLYDGAGNTWTISRSSGPGIQYLFPPTGFNPIGVTSAGGINYPFIPAGIPGYPDFGCTDCITVKSLTPGVPNCCVRICHGGGAPSPCGIGIEACLPGQPCKP